MVPVAVAVTAYQEVEGGGGGSVDISPLLFAHAFSVASAWKKIADDAPNLYSRVAHVSSRA